MFSVSNIRNLPIADDSIDLIFTDPPYPKIFLYCYEWLAREAIRVLKPGGFIMAMCGGMYLNKIFRYFDDVGLTYFWEFNHAVIADAPFIWQRQIIAKSKSILVYSKGPALPRVGGCQTLFWAEGKMKAFHHWGQDVASARYYIDHFSKEDDLILDPFIGGGTTAVACALINRRCIGLDVDSDALITTRFRMTNENAPYINLPIFAFQEATNV